MEAATPNQEGQEREQSAGGLSTRLARARRHSSSWSPLAPMETLTEGQSLDSSDERYHHKQHDRETRRGRFSTRKLGYTKDYGEEGSEGEGSGEVAETEGGDGVSASDEYGSTFFEEDANYASQSSDMSMVSFKPPAKPTSTTTAYTARKSEQIQTPPSRTNVAFTAPTPTIFDPGTQEDQKREIEDNDDTPSTPSTQGILTPTAHLSTITTTTTTHSPTTPLRKRGDLRPETPPTLPTQRPQSQYPNTAHSPLPLSTPATSSAPPTPSSQSRPTTPLTAPHDDSTISLSISSRAHVPYMAVDSPTHALRSHSPSASSPTIESFSICSPPSTPPTPRIASSSRPRSPLITPQQDVANKLHSPARLKHSSSPDITSTQHSPASVHTCSPTASKQADKAVSPSFPPSPGTPGYVPATCISPFPQSPSNLNLHSTLSSHRQWRGNGGEGGVDLSSLLRSALETALEEIAGLTTERDEALLVLLAARGTMADMRAQAAMHEKGAKLSERYIIALEKLAAKKDVVVPVQPVLEQQASATTEQKSLQTRLFAVEQGKENNFDPDLTTSAVVASLEARLLAAEHENESLTGTLHALRMKQISSEMRALSASPVAAAVLPVVHVEVKGAGKWLQEADEEEEEEEVVEFDDHDCDAGGGEGDRGAAALVALRAEHSEEMARFEAKYQKQSEEQQKDRKRLLSTVEEQVEARLAEARESLTLEERSEDALELQRDYSARVEEAAEVKAAGLMADYKAQAAVKRRVERDAKQAQFDKLKKLYHTKLSAVERELAALKDPTARQSLHQDNPRLSLDSTALLAPNSRLSMLVRNRSGDEDFSPDDHLESKGLQLGEQGLESKGLQRRGGGDRSSLRRGAAGKENDREVLDQEVFTQGPDIGDEEDFLAPLPNKRTRVKGAKGAKGEKAKPRRLALRAIN